MAFPPDLEPVPRNPRALYLTAAILVGVMVLGAVLILSAYNRYASEKAQDDRPAFVGRLMKHMAPLVRLQDGSTVDLFDLNGKVHILHAVSLRNPETFELELEIVRRALEQREEEPDFAVVSLVIDPGPHDNVVDVLTRAAEGLGAELPRWWVVTADPTLLHPFLKDRFQGTQLPELKDGVWTYDSTLILIDRNRHIRHAVVPQESGGRPFVTPFNFKLAAAWDADGISTGTERSNVEQLEFLLNQTIDRLLEEEFKP